MIEKVNDLNSILPFIKKYFPDFVLQDNPFEKFFCYKDSGKVQGFISYSIIYDRAELNYIAIDENYRNKGIAQKLFNYCLNDLKKNQVNTISLEVNTNNKVALCFYLKNKFEIINIRYKYYGQDDAYLMVLEVN